MSQLRKSAYLSISSKYAVLVIDTVMVIAISRLLTPEEIGVFSVCAVILGFAGILRNSGLTDYLIQEEELTQERQKSCLGAMVIISWVIGICLVLFRENIASYFDEPAVSILILIMVLEYFLSPIGINARAMLRRRFNFGLLLKIDLIASLVKAIVSIVLALQGYSYYSLAIGSLVGFLCSVLLIAFQKKEDFTIIPGLSEIKHVMKFGLPSFGTSAALYLDRYGAEFIIASFIGFTPVALFNRAMSLRELFEKLIFAGISPILMPAFSESHRNQGDIKKTYLDMLGLLLAFAWPFFAVLAVCALPVLRLLFGDQWDEAQSLVAILCLAGAIWMITSLVPTLMKSTGRVTNLFKVQIVITVFRLSFVIAAATKGINYVAWVFVITGALNMVLYMYLLDRYADISWRDVLVRNMNNVVVTIVTVAPSLLITKFDLLSSSSEFVLMIATGSISCIFWIASIYAVAHPITKEFNLLAARILRRDQVGPK